MKVNGSAVLHARVEEVWKALNDPAVLVRTIPGCEQLEEVSPDRYRMTVTAGVASIKGTYVGDVALTEQQEPSSFVLRASGAGAPGTVSAQVKVTLEPHPEGTLLTYDADAVVGGPVGGVGQRVLTGVAKKTAGEFFRAVDGVLTGAAAAPAVPAQAGPPAAAPTAGAVSSTAAAGETQPVAGGQPAGRVFSAPAPSGAGGLDVRNAIGGGVGGVLVGAAIALAGVWVGSRISARRG